MTLPLWKQILRTNFVNWEKLADFLELDDRQRRQLLHNPRFPLNLPMRLAKKITKGTLDDPILRQFVPLNDENLPIPGFGNDPLDEKSFRKGSKMLHKYQGRALLISTGACAMHCRYCFRQNFDYMSSEKGFEKELELIHEDSSINEVILSGGDPLTLPDQVLGSLLSRLSVIPHLKKIRFHTRFPIGIPERIDSSFLKLLDLPQQVWFVIHSNHARELDEEVLAHLRLLHAQNIMVLNQAVLLKGVNDTVESLKNLCERLVDHGILPYYLHQLDRVRGAAHFEVPQKRGMELIQEVAKQLPGYAVPKYVQEIPGESSKSIIS